MKQNIYGFVSAILVAATILPTGAALAGPDAGQQAAHRINIAGRQRMLSQRVTKAACFSMLGVDGPHQAVVMQDAFELFAQSHNALMFGDAEMGLGANGSKHFSDALKNISGSWSEFSSVVSSAADVGFVSLPALRRIDASGLVLLDTMNKAVASAYGTLDTHTPLLVSLTLDLAGRQRMLSQKAAKEFCLVQAGMDEETNRATLADTVQKFEMTLDLLIKGAPGMIMPAPNAEIRTQLEGVKQAWLGIKPDLLLSIAGDVATDAQRSAVASEMEQVLILMNQAVSLYEEFNQTQS